MYHEFFQKTNKKNWPTVVLWYLRSPTCFGSLFWYNWRHQKALSKLTDLYPSPWIFRSSYGPKLDGPGAKKEKKKMQTLECTVHKTVGHKNSFGNLTDFFLLYCYSLWGKKFLFSWRHPPHVVSYTNVLFPRKDMHSSLKIFHVLFW